MAQISLELAGLALERARETCPMAKLRKARKEHHCDNPTCKRPIAKREPYIDPGDSNPDCAGGFGGFRFCVICAGDSPL
jgi:hypothetical protein